MADAKKDKTGKDSEPIIHVAGSWKEQVEQEKKATSESSDKESGQEPAIRSDESWKEKAQREKDILSHIAEEDEKKEGESETEPPLPEASLLGLVMTLANQAIVGLGDVPNPLSGKKEKDLELAKYNIDMLQVLEEKTQGNLDPREKALLSQLLYDLRMRFIKVAG